VRPFDAAVYGGSAALLLAVACAANLIPALRAARVDPAEALRHARWAAAARPGISDGGRPCARPGNG